MSTLIDDNEDSKKSSYSPNLSDSIDTIKKAKKHIDNRNNNKFQQPDSKYAPNQKKMHDGNLPHEPHSSYYDNNLYNKTLSEGAKKANTTGSSAQGSASSTNTGTTASTTANSASTTSSAATTASATAASGGSTSGATASGAAVSNPIGAIVVGIIIAIVAIFMVFVCFFEYLTPSNVLKTASSFVKSAISTQLDKFTDSISDFFADLFGIYDDVEQLEAPINGYDKKNEYDVAFIQNYNAIITAINHAYGDYILADNGFLDQYCKNHNLDFDKTIESINERYPDGYQNIYADVNYAELINILSLGYETDAYGSHVQNGDTEELYEFLINEDNYELYFNLEITVVTTNQNSTSNTQTNEDNTNSLTDNVENLLDDDGTLNTDIITPSEEKDSEIENSNNQSESSSYAEITIHPYCVSDLYKALDIKKDEEILPGLTYHEYAELKLQQDIAISENPNGGYRKIYYTLGMGNPRAEWDYSFNSTPMFDLFAPLETDVSENAKIVYDALIADGFTKEGASGVCGNLMAENGFRTTMSGEGGSVGLAQWTGGRKEALIAHATEIGLDVTDIRAQTSFLLLELKSSKYDVVRNATDVQYATDYIAYYYEACSRYKTQEAHARSKYSYISWSRYLWSESMETHILDLGKRRLSALTYYATF